VTPAEEATSPQAARGGNDFGRLAAIGALVLVVVAILYLFLFAGGDGHKYRLTMETGGQLVKGNQVLIGGAPVGSIDDVKLVENGQVEIAISVDRPLHEGTQAVNRATSISGIANRYISLQPGPDNAPELEDNQVIAAVDTTSPVDLDQLFNTLREPERKGLQDIIQGSATIYAGRAAEANQTYRYLSPSLVATDKLLQELNRDEQVFTDWLVDGASVVSALAERRDDLAELTSNGNQAMAAIASQNESFDRALVALPPALRQANTTFFNLRATLDDLDPLVAAAKPATKNLAPFLRQFKPVIQRSIPVFRDLRRAVNLKGKNNDLADAFGKLPAVESAGARSVGPSVQAMRDSEPTLTFIRPYMPDLLGALARLGQVTGYYDADGHYARVEPAGTSAFRCNPPPCGPGGVKTLDPITLNEVFADYLPDNLRVFRRCPGGTTQPALDASNPFVSPPFPGPPTGAPTGPVAPGPTGNIDCTAADIPPGP
jgi:phospholipid/cholesterol/gamma-HCH transport system substrate-binding protein